MKRLDPMTQLFHSIHDFIVIIFTADAFGAACGNGRHAQFHLIFNIVSGSVSKAANDRRQCKQVDDYCSSHSLFVDELSTEVLLIRS